MSNAQELSCQRKRLQALRRLVAETGGYLASARSAAHASAFVDSVLASVHRIMLSTSHCYFSGVCSNHCSSPRSCLA